MIQLNFHAPTPPRRLAPRRRPRSATASTRERRAGWGDPKLQLVAARTRWSTRPTGRTRTSTARPSTWARPARRGSGCDDTRNADLVTHPTCETIPSDPPQAAAAVSLDRVRGALGRAAAGLLQRAHRPQPEGRSGREPIRWSQSWRDRAYAVPAGGALGHATRPTSSAALMAQRVAAAVAGDQPPVPTIAVVLAVLAALIVYGLQRATWRRRRRLRLAAGAPGARCSRRAARMYVSRPRLFVGIGVLLLPVSLVITDPAGDRVAARLSLLGVEVEGEAAGVLRARGGGDRHGADAARAGRGAGGDGAGDGRDRRRPAGAAGAGPTGWRWAAAAAAGRDRDRGGGGVGAADPVPVPDARSRSGWPCAGR